MLNVIAEMMTKMKLSIVDESEATTLAGSRVLIVDDEAAIANLLAEYLQGSYVCETARSAEEAIELVQAREFSVVLTDINMSGIGGLQLVEKLKEISPSTVCVMISGSQNIDAAIGALRNGAFDYVRKPFELSSVKAVVEKAFQRFLNNKHQIDGQADMQRRLNGQHDRLQYMIGHDQITGLQNREGFTREITRAIKTRNTAGTRTGIVLIAIERFRSLREKLGNDMANQALREIVRRWQPMLGDNINIARLEGDVFGLLVRSISSTGDILDILRPLDDSLNTPIEIGAHQFEFALRAGIAFGPDGGNDAASLEHAAAIALSESFTSGSSPFRFYEPGMNVTAKRVLDIETGLRSALRDREILNFYQPKVDFCSGKIVGMEALVRWQSPKFGLVSPSEFITISEDIGLADQLGLQVLTDACRDAKSLFDAGHPLKVCVNVSAKQLMNEWLPEMVRFVLSSSGLPASHLEVEITETAVVENFEKASLIIDRLKEIGIQIAIDDFGTGYSSLAYLKRFAVDTLKVDRTFVKDIVEDELSIEFVSAIVVMAEKLGLKTVIEGIENSEQLKRLSGFGCNEWQGFLCSKPVDIESFKKLL